MVTEVGGGELEALAEAARLEMQVTVRAIAVALEGLPRGRGEGEHGGRGRGDLLPEGDGCDPRPEVAEARREKRLAVPENPVDARIEPIDPAFLDPRSEAQARADVRAAESARALWTMRSARSRPASRVPCGWKSGSVNAIARLRSSNGIGMPG